MASPTAKETTELQMGSLPQVETRSDAVTDSVAKSPSWPLGVSGTEQESSKNSGLANLDPTQQGLLVVAKSLPNVTPGKNQSSLPHSPSLQVNDIPKVTFNNGGVSPAIDQSQNQNAPGPFQQQLASSQNHVTQNNTIEQTTTISSAQSHYKVHWLVGLIFLTLYFFGFGFAILSKALALTKHDIVSLPVINDIFIVMIAVALLHIGFGVAMAIQTGRYIKSPSPAGYSSSSSFQRLNQFHNRVTGQQSTESTTPMLQDQQQPLQQQQQDLPLGTNPESMQHTGHLNNQSQGQAALLNQQTNQPQSQQGTDQSFGTRLKSFFSFGQTASSTQQMQQPNQQSMNQLGTNSQQMMQQNQMQGPGTNPQMMQQNPMSQPQMMQQNQMSQQQMMQQNQMAQSQLPQGQIPGATQQMMPQNQVPQGQVPGLLQQVGQPMQQNAGQFQAPSTGMMQQYQQPQSAGQFTQPGMGQMSMGNQSFMQPGQSQAQYAM